MNNTRPDLSIVIVSYNAQAFLKLTLYSVQKAIKDIDCEVLLVDNSPTGDIVLMVRSLFPFVKIIDNNKNLGFAKANNLALKQAQGKIAILLNPDTIIAEDTFLNIIRFYNKRLITGGVGVKMINGAGHYLKESKRGFPSVFTSFCKISGLTKLAPKSRLFAKYYEGHLNKDTNQEVDILSGAFLAIPRDNNEKLMLLNEQYFMYGEDIDLSYRLRLKFGQNHYLADSPIIHFKGESTPKGKLILWHFYRSMWLFYRDHIRKRKNVLKTILVWIGINTVMQIKFLSLSLFNARKNNTDLQIPTLINLLSDNEDLLTILKQQFPSAQISLFRQWSEIKHPGSLTLIDISYIELKQIIQQVMTNSKTMKFGYITHDGTHAILSHSSKEKGVVIPL